MRTWSVTVILVFLVALVFHLTGYLELIRVGEISIFGAIFEAKYMIVEIIIAVVGLWGILRNKNYSISLLTLLFIGIPLYHVGVHAQFWLTHGGWIYEGIERITLARLLAKDFVLVFGIPVLIIYWSGGEVENKITLSKS